MSLIMLSNITKRHGGDQDTTFALRGVSLTIERGEFVAITGPSGCGKSTLLNILGALDIPTSGSYELDGLDTSDATLDELALLRRRSIGFVFQRYHLIPDLTAIDNVALPAFYDHVSPAVRRAKSVNLLSQLGLSDRRSSLPSQLSGGEQQRVAIARSLVNGAALILADEPTGALDSENGRTVLSILEDLHSQGYTIVMVTHNLEIAQSADRVVEMRDGQIVLDSVLKPNFEGVVRTDEGPARHARGLRDYFSEFFLLSINSIFRNRLRSGLTTLGVLIGTFAVALSIAVSQGAQASIAKDAGQLYTNSLRIYKGKEWNDPFAAGVQTINANDLTTLSKLSFVQSVSPVVEAERTVRRLHRDIKARVEGLDTAGIFSMGAKIESGRDITGNDVSTSANVALVEIAALERLFGHEDPIGKVMIIGEIPFVVVGTVRSKSTDPQSNQIYVPFTTMQIKVLGISYFDGLTVYLGKQTDPLTSEKVVTDTLIRSHGSKDFNIINTAVNWASFTGIAAVASLALGGVAAISLMVGGIGVMNIMLVSVVERTREIGIRSAVGATASDIRFQFLIESVVICMVGAAAGLFLAFIVCLAIGAVSDRLQPSLGMTSIGVSMFVCVVTGLLFGWLPAKRASTLRPVVALNAE